MLISDWSSDVCSSDLSWTSSGDGRPIYGVLVTPPALAPGVPSKTVVLAHGGPYDSWSSAWQGSWIDWAQLLASHGYVVLRPNPAGSAGPGNELRPGGKAGWGRQDSKSIGRAAWREKLSKEG